MHIQRAPLEDAFDQANRFNTGAKQFLLESEQPMMYRDVVAVAAANVADYKLLKPYLEQVHYKVFRTYFPPFDGIENETLPIIVGESIDNTSFAKIAPEIASRTKAVIVHPSFLAHELKLDLSDAVFTFGLPGAGNMIVQDTIRHILGLRERSYDQVKSWSAGAHVIMCGLLTEAMKNAGFTPEGIGYAGPGYVNAYASKDERHIFLPFVPSQMYVADTVHGSHNPPVPSMIARIKESGGKIVIICRDPLDTMLSVANKIAYVMAEKNGTARADELKILLHRSDIFDAFIAEASAFFAACNLIRADAHIVRYEDFMRNPKTEIERISGLLTIPVSIETADALVANISNKEFMPGHLNEPGTGKWRGVLSETHIAKAKMHGLFDAARPFGYENDIAIDLSRDDLALSNLTSAFSKLFYMDVPTLRKVVAAENIVAEVAGIEVIADHVDDLLAWTDEVECNHALRAALTASVLAPPY